MGISTRKNTYDTPPDPRSRRETPCGTAPLSVEGAPVSPMSLSTHREPSNAAVTVFQPISHPVLRSLDLVKVSAFLKERERYELDIAEKKIELPTLTAAPYTACIDRALLRNMHFLGKFDDIAPNVAVIDLSSDHVKTFISGLVKKPSSGYDPRAIDGALRGLAMPSHIADPDARVLHFANSFFERLEAIGYRSFRDTNKEKTVALMCEHVTPPRLREVMQRKLEFDSDLKADVRGFVKSLCAEAASCQTYHVHDRHARTSRSPENTEKTKKTQKPKELKEPPVCLLPAHKAKNIRHWLKDCPDCDEKTRKKLRTTYAEERKKKAVGGTKRVGERSNSQTSESSILFNATYADRVRDIVVADIGADINLMGEILLNKLQCAGAKVHVTDLPRPMRYRMAAGTTPKGENAEIVCERTVVADLKLHVRHGSTLVLRNLRWLVTKQDVGEPLLGRPTLEALGLNCADILASAADRLNGETDLRDLYPDLIPAPEGKVARLVQEGVFHSNKGIDDMEDEEWLDIGEDNPEEKAAATEKLIQEAVSNGISKTGQAELRRIVAEYDDVLRLRLGAGPPADVQPMKLELSDNVRPVQARPRRYPPDKRDFMERYTGKLLEYGFVRITNNADWVAAPLIVSKAPPANFRLTVDLRPVNAVTKPMVWPMPNLDAEIADMKYSKCFASIDFVSGYWQLPMAEESQPLHAFMTNNAVVQPTRTLQGGRNSGANFQGKVEPLFSDLREWLKAWLDDFALHHSTEAGMLDVLRQFLEICRLKNLRVSIPKSHLFQRELKWCGRIISEEGVQYDPKHFDGIVNCSLPVTAGKLCEYVHCAGWMSQGIPEFAKRIAPLRSLLEVAYKKSGKRTKKSISKIYLSTIGWNQEHADAFLDIQTQLREQLKLAHRDKEKKLCIYTDASDRYWAAVVTQCEPSELSKPVAEQIHQPLAFLSGEFKGPQFGWTTYEKEGFAVAETFHRLDYMLMCEQDIRIFTDHRNLLFVFAPSTLEPTLGRHKVLKVLRWAVFLSQFMYRIEHVDGDENIMADIMTRWLRGYRVNEKTIKRVAHLLQAIDIVPSPLETKFDWPNASAIANAQKKHISERPIDAIQAEDGTWTVRGLIWIPDSADQLQLRLLIVAHCGNAGHRGAESTADLLQEQFIWETLDADCRSFISNCIHCIMAKTGDKIPRPYATALHATLPNEVVHFDYLFMGPSSTGEKYIFVIKDDLSSYIWFVPTTNASSDFAARALARWIRTFTAMTTWVSDQGTHFKNEVMNILANDYRITHHFTTAYSPWSNGTVEAVNRNVMSACRALTTEAKLGPHDWPELVPVLESIINEAPTARLGKRSDGVSRSPLEVMTGLKPRRSILRGATGIHGSKSLILDRVRAEQSFNIEKLQKDLDLMHKSVNNVVSRNRARQIKAHNKRTNIVAPSFSIGDFVLVRRGQDKGHKMNFRWLGPRRILNAESDLV